MRSAPHPTQSTVVTSSGEAEYYAVVCALGLAAAMLDLGRELKLRLWVDTSAANSVADRLGLGRDRERVVPLLWLQGDVLQRRVEICKIRGDLNPEDVQSEPRALSEPRGT